MNNQDHNPKESEPGIAPSEEQSPKSSIFRLIGSTVLFIVLVIATVGAIFDYDFEKHSTVRFVVFEIVFIGLTIKCFYWMRDSYRKR